MKDKNKQEYPDANNKSLIFKTSREEHYTMQNTLKSLKYAMSNAESIDFPNRHNLLEIYFDIIKDAHLNSIVKHRKTRVEGLEFSLIKSNGTVDKKSVELFEQQWFNKFLDYTLDSMFYGNSLIELNRKGSDINCLLIPRENVIPEFTQIKTYPSATYGDIDYSAPIYSKRLIDVNNNNDNRNLGEFLSISKLVLFKTEVLLNWSQHIEIYGQPIRIATTDSQDPVEVNSLLKYLKDLGRSGYIVKDSQTDIDFVGAEGNSSSSGMYKDFENYMNEEMSKKILGGTMITDSGSSRSQSEVHERGSYLYTKADISFIEGVINNQLLPVLRNMGLISPKGIKFKFQEPEILTIDEKIKVDEFLLNNFEIKDIEYFNKRYGVELEFKEKAVEVIEPEEEEIITQEEIIE